MAAPVVTGRGEFETIITRVAAFRDEVQGKIQSMHQRGINVFDQDYRPIPGITPTKYQVAYVDAFRQELQDAYDRCEAEVDGGAYAVAVDVNGYAAIHNSRFSKPLTGDAQADLVGNRTMRKFNNPGELRAASNTRRVFIRTYMRDTGEVLCDLAMPITVAGRHWGNVRVGTLCQALAGKGA